MKLTTLSRKKLRVLLGGGVAAVASQLFFARFGDWLSVNILNPISASPTYTNYVVPSVVAIIPFALVISVIAYLMTEEDDAVQPVVKEHEPLSPAPKKLDSASQQVGQHTFSPEKCKFLYELGIVDITPDLRGSAFHPHQCMGQTRKHLMFMGILGSKWVDDSGFEDFAKRIDLVGGSLRFLLIHPQGRSYSKLTALRQGKISPASLSKFHQLKQKYPSLRVKLYEELPVFRLVFFDGQTLALSRYKLDHHGYSQSQQGWDAPHLVISSVPQWSLFETFEEYFNNVWNRSTDLDDYFASASTSKDTPVS